MKRISIITVVFFLILSVYLSLGLVRFLTRQICVKQLHMNNAFVQFVFQRDKKLLDEAAEYAGDLVYDPIDWEKLYPFPEEEKDTDGEESIQKTSMELVEKYELKVEKSKENISNYVEQYHPLQLYMKWLSGGYNLVTMGREAALASEGLYVARGKWLYEHQIRKESGSSEGGYDQEDINQLADNVADFYHFLEERNIGFIYATVGSKPCPYDKSLETPFCDDLNKLSFLQALDERSVPNYDLSFMMPQDPDAWYSMYYCTDGHWNDYAGLWASGVLAQYLNTNCGFAFNTQLFDLDQYSEETRDNYFRGQTGRRISPFLWGRESYTRLNPKYDTEFLVTHYSNKGIEEREGELLDVFFNNDIYEDMAGWTEADCYDKTKGDCRYIENDDLYTIVNKKVPDNKDKKILIVRDSYISYLAPYLSTDVGEVDLIYNPKFTGSIRTYIEKTKPDAVIMLLVNSNIQPQWAVDNVNSGYHFDLR